MPAAERQAASEPAERVLFIGNSLTAANDLPGIVEAFARSTAGPALSCRTVVFADHSLEDHWARGDAARAIAEGRWSTVVLQQGPSALPESQVLLREFTKRFDGLIRKAGARTALYMVWPSKARAQDFDGVSASYTAAAKDVGGLLLPAGDAWRAAWQRDPGLQLYGPDGFHPSPLGSYLAALVVFHGVTGRAPAGLPATARLGSGATIVVPPAQAALFQEVASTISRRTGRGIAGADSRPSGRR
jgi:hypothetical protein